MKKLEIEELSIQIRQKILIESLKDSNFGISFVFYNQFEKAYTYNVKLKNYKSMLRILKLERSK